MVEPDDRPASEPANPPSPRRDPQASPETPPPAVLRPPPGPGLLGLLYNHNPFYILSALLVLVGVKESFPSSESPAYDWALLGVLVAYVSVLAAVAILIVRKGSVWEDARTILLIVVFLLLALSVNFDEKVISSPAVGSLLLVAGLAFSLLVTAALLVGLRVRLPPLYLWPFVAMLCGFFLYPILLTVVLRLGPRGATDWGALGFSPFFAVLLLTLIPALRRGPAYVRDAGTPWPWPWFPWTLYVFVGACACGRIFYVTIPFGLGWTIRLSPVAEPLRTIFGPYFLVPVALAACALVLEGAVVAGRRRLQRAILVVPGLLLLATMTCPPVSQAQERLLGGGLSYPAQREFLDALVKGLASPAFLVLCGVVVFHAWAWARGVAWSEVGCVLSILALSVVGRETLDFATLVTPRLAPFLVVAAIQIAAALLRPSSARWFVALAAGTLAATLGLRETWFLAWGGAIPAHICIAGALVLGATFRDRFAPALRAIGTGALTAAVGLILYLHGLDLEGPVRLGVPAWAAMTYLAAAPVVQILYWVLLPDPRVLRIFLATLAVFVPRLFFEVIRLFWQLGVWIARLRWGLGTWLLLGGLASLVVGVAISLAKAGLVPGVGARGRRGERAAPPESSAPPTPPLPGTPTPPLTPPPTAVPTPSPPPAPGGSEGILEEPER